MKYQIYNKDNKKKYDDADYEGVKSLYTLLV